jgi:hypothetical protein
MSNNTFFNNDLQLLSNRKALELNNVSKDAFIARGQQATIERKYKVIIEALEGLYDLNIQHSCSLVELINQFDSI